MMMGLFSGTKEPAVRDAAWEYMRYFDSREATAIKTRVMVESGLGRFIHPRYLRLFGYPEIERLSPPGWARTFDVAMETGKPEPYGGNSNLAYEMMTLPLQKAETMVLKDQLPDAQGRRLDILQGLLRDGVRRANEQMMGVVSPRDRLIRRSVAGGGAGGHSGGICSGISQDYPALLAACHRAGRRRAGGRASPHHVGGAASPAGGFDGFPLALCSPAARFADGVPGLSAAGCLHVGGLG
jgi:hypothetical protein